MAYSSIRVTVGVLIAITRYYLLLRVAQAICTAVSSI